MSTAAPSYHDGLRMVRILKLLEDTHRRSMLLDGLAQELEVHRRTVRRYVQAMEKEFVGPDDEPVIRIEGRGARARVVLAAQPEPTSARLYQYAAVYAATRSLSAGGGSPLAESAEALVAKLEDGFEGKLKPLARRVSECFVYVPFGPKDYRRGGEAVSTVVLATLYRRPLLLHYRTRTGWRYRCRFEPYAMVLYRDALFVHGRQRGVGPASGLRLLALDRIVEAEILRKESFEPPEDYRPEDHFEGQLGLWTDDAEPERVRLVFSARAARTARERQWPNQQGWTEREDGRFELELQVPITPEVVTWVLTWGPEAEVLSPPSLREQVGERLERAAAAYRSEAPPS